VRRPTRQTVTGAHTLLIAGLAVAGCRTQPLLAPDPAEPIFRTERIPAAWDRYNHTATIVAMPDGELLVAWGSGARELANDTRIVLSRRAPGPDAEWTLPVTAADTPDRPDANCVLFLDDAGRLHLLHSVIFGGSFCTSYVEGRTSEDAGMTWSDGRVALPAVCTLLKNRPIRLRDGRWILPAYIEASYASHFYFSFDGGRIWLPGSPPIVTLPFANLQPAVVQTSSGALLALMRSTAGAGYTWQGVSLEGVAWLMTPRPDIPNPGSGLDLLRLTSGHLVMAYNNSTSARSPLVVSISADEGRTWSPPRTLDAGDGQYSYPSLIESPDGMIHCAYSFRLEAIQHAEFNRAWLEAAD